VSAPFQPVDVAYAEAQFRALGAAEPGKLLALFTAMAPADQHHGIEVARALAEEGATDLALLVAALLHDVGKVMAPVGILARVWVVLGEHFTPERAQRWSETSSDAAPPRGLRRGFVVRRHHAAWGATLVATVGAPARTVAWIRHHHDPPGADPWLAALQRADET
jgi:hypothetical protein